MRLQRVDGILFRCAVESHERRRIAVTGAWRASTAVDLEYDAHGRLTGVGDTPDAHRRTVRKRALVQDAVHGACKVHGTDGERNQRSASSASYVNFGMLDTITIGSLEVRSAQPAAKAGGRSRPPILFVPGYLATAWVYESYLSFFADRGYAGFAVNLRGREGSRLPSGTFLGRVTLDDYIADAREVARWLAERVGQPIVFGHSMGGLIAQKLGEEGLARALVLLSPAPPRGISVMTPAVLRRQLRYLPALLRSRRIVPRFSDMRALVLNRVPATEQETMFARFVPDSGRAGRDMSLGAVRVDPERVRANGCKVLVATSDDDRFIPQRIAQRIAQRYHAPLYIARGHGHLMLQEPGWQEAAEFIAGWLDREVVR